MIKKELHGYYYDGKTLYEYTDRDWETHQPYIKF